MENLVSQFLERIGSDMFEKHQSHSPSMTAKAIVKRNINGWKFWRIKDENGDWVGLDTIRKQDGYRHGNE